MPTLRDHLAAAEDAGKGGGHHGGHHHHGGGRGRGRGGGVVFYDRSPDVIVVTDDCPPGFYIDEFGDCRPLPYHSMSRTRVPQAGRIPGPNQRGASRPLLPSPQASDASHFGVGTAATPEAAGDAGRILPRFVTSSDVHDLKMRLNGYVLSLDAVVLSCPDMPAPIRDGWNAFSQGWKTFFQQGEGFWTAGAEMDQAEAYQADIQTWTQRISTTTCKIDPKTQQATTPPKGMLPPPPSTEGEGGTDVSEFAGTVKTVAVVAVILAVLFYADRAGVFSASSTALAKRA